jgi:hypothetical protein
VHFLVVVGLSSINACLKAPYVRNHLNSIDLLSFGCCLLSRSTLLIASTKHLKCPLDYHFHISLPSTTIGLPIKGGKPLYIGRSDLSPKNHSWHLLEIYWLIDSSERLNLRSNHDSYFKSFSFYLFKSFYFYQNDFQLSLELKLRLHLEFNLDLPIEYQMCAKYTP